VVIQKAEWGMYAITRIARYSGHTVYPIVTFVLGTLAAARQAILDEINEIREITPEHVIQEDGRAWYVGTRLHREAR
jgi:hypothetical protein